MREIKFRAWDKETGAMLDKDKYVLMWFRGDGETVFDNAERFELMQYIGLKDKNDKEIYEGDIVKDTDSNYIGQVIFDLESLCFTTKFQSNELWGFVPRHGKDNHCEVIGNIYENKELLEVSEVS